MGGNLRKYKKTPEYQQVNHQMTVSEFKYIFFWEYFHRVLGRLVGVAFFVPFAYFWLRKKLSRELVPKLLGIFMLGGLQGAMGWYMVKSGLVDDPRVSQYRLTAHLSIAFLIFISMFWVGLGLVAERARETADAALRKVQRIGFWLCLLVGYMVVTGGFVAGIRAGKALQHLSADERARRAARDLHDRPVVSQFLQQHGHDAVQPSPRRLAAGVHRALAVVQAACAASGDDACPQRCDAAAGGPCLPDLARHRDAAAGGAGGPRGGASRWGDACLRYPALAQP